MLVIQTARYLSERIRPARHLGLALMLGVAAVPNVHAQSSVTIYGIINDAVQYISNVGGHSVTELSSGAMQLDRLGFRGAEDLGGGNRAVFVLEEGFNPNTGEVSPPGSEAFSQQAYLGLDNAKFGALTFGYQRDFMYSLPYDPVMYMSAMMGGVGGGPGTSFLDNHLPGISYNNTVKWVDKIGAFTTGAMYGFGSETPGQSSFMYSMHLSFATPGFQAGMSYLDDKTGLPEPSSPPGTPVYNEKIFGTGATLKLDPVLLTAVFSDARSQITQARNDMLDTGVIYYFNPFTYVGFDLGAAWARNSQNQSGGAKQVAIAVDHHLSKATDVYAIAILIHATGFAQATIGVPGGAAGPSSSPSQSSVQIGIRHLF